MHHGVVLLLEDRCKVEKSIRWNLGGRRSNWTALPLALPSVIVIAAFRKRLQHSSTAPLNVLLAPRYSFVSALFTFYGPILWIGQNPPSESHVDGFSCSFVWRIELRTKSLWATRTTTGILIGQHFA
jgi:hypothetical protein